MMKLLYWIDVDKLHWNRLPSNPNAIDLLRYVIGQKYRYL